MKIKVGEKILTKISQYIDLNLYTKLAILTDDLIGNFWLNELKKSLKKDFLLIEEIIKKYQLFQKINLSKIDLKNLMINDKKNINQKILLSLPEKIGKAVFNVYMPEKIINLAIDYISI